LEEQRHEGNPTVKYSKNSKPFEPIIEAQITNSAVSSAKPADWETPSSTPDAEKAVEEEDQDDTVYPGPLGLALLSIGLMLCVFLIALDRTIITPVCTRKHLALHLLMQ